MTELIFVRHAETDLAGTFCGHSDPPLNARGRTQLKQLLDRLAARPPEAIYSSDLRRAVETAEAISRAFSIPCTTSRGLREIHFGDWEGLTWDKIEARSPEQAKLWVEAYPHGCAPGGESFTDFERRVLEETGELSQKLESGRIAVVTHGGVMRTVLQRLAGQTDVRAWELTKQYGSVFTYAEGRVLE